MASLTTDVRTVERCVQQMRKTGWCILSGAADAKTIAAIDINLAPCFTAAPFCQGNFYGETTQRFGRLLIRSPHMAGLVQHPLILAIAEAILSPYCDCIQLNVTQAIAIHPGAPAQAPHRDDDMWQSCKDGTDYLINVIWPLTPFRNENGGTRLWSGSHYSSARATTPTGSPDVPELDPGSALLFLGSTLHAAGANKSDAVRRGLVIGYSLGWLKPYENPWLAYPPQVARHFSPDLAALVGYRQHRPNLGNFEGQCPSVLFDDVPDTFLPAIDALRPDQKDMVDAFAQAQQALR